MKNIVLSFLLIFSLGYSFRIGPMSIGALHPANTVFLFSDYEVVFDDGFVEEVVVAALVSDINIYPNPAKSNNVELTYTLSGEMDLKVLIYNIYGNLVISKEISKGAAGGVLGYNEVPVTLRDMFGSSLSNGIYFCLLIDPANTTKPLGTFKLAVAK
jgi:hypothetical protein